MQILSKILSKTDITRRCAVPMKYFRRRRFPKLVDFVVKDECGHNWILFSSTRNPGNDTIHPKHPKPVLIKEWIPFARHMKLCVGDRLIIYEEQDETGLIQHRIKVERQTRPGTRCCPVMNQKLDKKMSSINQNGGNESPATFQHSGNLSADVLNCDLGGTAASRTSSFDNKQMQTSHSTSQDIPCYKMEGTSLRLSSEGATTAKGYSIYKEKTAILHRVSQGITCDQTKTPNLSLHLGLTPQPTNTECQQHAYMQETGPKPIKLFGQLLISLESKVEDNKTEDKTCHQTETPNLRLSLGVTPHPSNTRRPQHAYMQEKEPKTIEFLGSWRSKAK